MLPTRRPVRESGVGPHDSPPLTIDEARALTGLDLVPADSVVERESRLSYAELEEVTESNTHARLRELAIMVFNDYGYRVFPAGVGVRGVFAFADFLAVRDQRCIFVEVLTDRKATDPCLRQKQQLAARGELAFVFIGNLEGRQPSALEVQDRAAKAHDVLLGSWGPGRCNHLKPAHPFQRFAFDVAPAQSLTIGVDCLLRGSLVELTFSLLAASYPRTRIGTLSFDPATSGLPTFLDRVTNLMAAALVGTWGKPRSGHSVLSHTASGKRLARRSGLNPRDRRSEPDRIVPHTMEVQPAAAGQAIATIHQAASEYRLALHWTGQPHEAVAAQSSLARPRPSKAADADDLNTLLQFMRARAANNIERKALLSSLGWTAHRGTRVIRHLVSEGLLWARATPAGPIYCGLSERQRTAAEIQLQLHTLRRPPAK